MGFLKALVGINGKLTAIKKLNASVLTVLLVIGVAGALAGPIFSIHDFAATKAISDSVKKLKYPVNMYYRDGNEYLAYFGVENESQLRDLVIEEFSSCVSYTCYTGKASDPNEKDASGKPKFNPDKYILDRQIDGPWNNYAARKNGDNAGRSKTVDSGKAPAREDKTPSGEDDWEDITPTLPQPIDTKFSRWGDVDYIKKPVLMGFLHLCWLIPFILWRLGTIWVGWILKKEESPS